MKSFALNTLILFIGVGASASVWETDKVWNDQWEAQYSVWIKNEFNENFFTQGKWGRIPTDCADAVYVSRLIFAYENKLPFSMKDPTGGSNYISQKMGRYDGEQEELRRVRRFIDFVMEMGSTETLPDDTYPTKIDRDHVRPGTVWSRVRKTAGNIWDTWFGRGDAQGVAGHAEIVKEVKETGAIYLIGSTVPPEIRPLIVTSSFVFLPTDSSTGLRNWIQPQNRDLSKSQNPGYSKEQYTMGEAGRGRSLDAWVDEVQSRLALRAETREEKLKRFGEDLCSLTQARIPIVADGVKYSQKIGRCMNSEEYDNWSTPTRDNRVKTTLQSMMKYAGLGSNLSFEKIDLLASYLDQCPALAITPSRSLSLRDYLHGFSDNRVSSNPNDSLEARWGLAESNADHCPQYD